MTMTSFNIEDDLANASRGAIEVVVSFVGAGDRWCFFMTPAALSACGDWIPGTNVRVHVGVAHMFVVSEIDESVIRQVLELSDEAGELLAHTVAVE